MTTLGRLVPDICGFSVWNCFTPPFRRLDKILKRPLDFLGGGEYFCAPAVAK